MRNCDPVCPTVCEGDHALGAGALANSLWQAGFRGTILLGWRGTLPAWLPAEHHLSKRWEPATGLELVFIPLPDGIAANQLKPWLLVEALDRLAPEAERFSLFDADVLVVAPFAYLESLVEEAPALVVDLWFPREPMVHPWRRAWAELCREAGYPVRAMEDTYGSAFVGLRRRHRQLADVWWHLMRELHRRRPDVVGRFKPGTRMTDPFHHTDQNMLAAAVMAIDLPICTLGPEAFGFAGSAHTLLHPLADKPWRGSALGRLLRLGVRPDLYARHWLRHLASPIAVLPRPRRWWHQCDSDAAVLLSRLYRAA